MNSLLSEIEVALALHDVSQTAFGYAVAGDPTLVAKLRRGRQVRSAMEEKIRSALRRLEETGAL